MRSGVLASSECSRTDGSKRRPTAIVIRASEKNDVDSQNGSQMRENPVLLAIEESEGSIYIYYFKSVITRIRVNSYSKVRREAEDARRAGRLSWPFLFASVTSESAVRMRF